MHIRILIAINNILSNNSVSKQNCSMDILVQSSILLRARLQDGSSASCHVSFALALKCHSKSDSTPCWGGSPNWLAYMPGCVQTYIAAQLQASGDQVGFKYPATPRPAHSRMMGLALIKWGGILMRNNWNARLTIARLPGGPGGTGRNGANQNDGRVVTYLEVRPSVQSSSTRIRAVELSISFSLLPSSSSLPEMRRVANWIA